MLDFDFIDAHTIMYKICNKLKNDNLPVFVYGAIETAIRKTKELEKYDISVSGYFVDDKFYTYDTFNGKKVYKLSEMLSLFDKFNTIIGFYNYGILSNRIVKDDILYVVDDRFKDKGDVVILPSNDVFNEEFWQDNKAKFIENFKLFSDDKSKNIYKAYLRYKTYGYCEELISYFQPEHYFDGCIKLDNNEVFVDCGAYIGDTSDEFIKRVNGKYEHIYMFEADECNLSKISIDNNNITLIPKAVWCDDGVLYFNCNATSSASSVVNYEDDRGGGKNYGY